MDIGGIYMAEEEVKQQESIEEDKIDEEVITEEIEDLEEAKAQTGIILDYIDKEYPTIGEVRIYHPTLNVESEVEMVYIEEFNKLLMDSDLPTIRKLEKILQEKGYWTEEDDKEIEDIITLMTNRQIDVAQIRRQLKKTKTNQTKLINKFKKLTQEIYIIQTDLALATARKSSLFESTIEKRAERMGLLFKITRCVKRLDGSYVWNTIDELGNDNSQTVKPLIFDAIKFWRGVSSPLSDDLLDLISGS